jgi:anaerobic magnesium-protoporphyrin IX monomethyl ester cyclase
MFYDDELNVNKSLVELMRGITALQKKHGVEFRLRGFNKAELTTQEQCDAMYEAGFRWMLTGFESGHPRILDNINKRATVEDNDRCVEFARKAGLKVKALMSIGHAGESAETVEATKQWLLRTRPDDFDCTIITPYPGSPYYDEAVRASGLQQLAWASCGQDLKWNTIWTYTAPRTGDRLHAVELDYTKEADYYKGKPDGGYVSNVFTDHLSPAELVRLRDDLEKTVRAELNIPFNAGAPGIQYEASMGQTKLPTNILRSAP